MRGVRLGQGRARFDRQQHPVRQARATYGRKKALHVGACARADDDDLHRVLQELRVVEEGRQREGVAR